MITLYYIFRILFNCWHWKTSYKSTYVYLGLKHYFGYKGKDKKPLFTVLYELERLSIYWRCFPDIYFQVSMFLRSWTDFEKMKSFVPQDAYFKIEKLYDSNYCVLLDDKMIFHDLLYYYKIPVPSVFFIFKNNRFLSCDQTEEYSDNVIEKMLLNITDSRIFVKRNVGGEATGVTVFTRKEGRYFHNDILVSANYIREKFRDMNIFFEKQVIQPKYVSELNPDTVNTIRVVASRDNLNKISIFSTTLRVGRKGSFVDNAARGGLIVPINVKDGSMGENGLRMYDTNVYQFHPDTNICFAGRRINEWESVIALVNKTLNVLPVFHSLGFDIAISEDGPIIIEINTGAGMFLAQAGRPYGFGKKFLQS